MFYYFFPEVIHIDWNADRSLYLQWFLATALFIVVWAAHLHTYFTYSPFWHWLSLQKKNGEKIEVRDPDSNNGGAQTSHKLNDTQMTEVIECSLCHGSISEALLHSLYISSHKSVSTLGSLKWQWVWAVQRRNAEDRAGAYLPWQIQG